MHIEPGVLALAKVASANVAAIGLTGAAVVALTQSSRLILKTVLAALFFCVFMQAFHMKVGPSELHFVGAIPIYLILGVVPTLLGFGVGLAIQALLFEPNDMVHLGVNFLTLALPLLFVHYTQDDKLRQIRMTSVLKLDGLYYSGVVLMVGFWLSVGDVATPFAAWLQFAVSYATVAVLEPLVTVAMVLMIQRWRHNELVKKCFLLHTVA